MTRIFQLQTLYLLDISKLRASLAIILSYPTRARGIIVTYALNVWSREKQLVLFHLRVTMFTETKSRETSGLEGKQN